MKLRCIVLTDFTDDQWDKVLTAKLKGSKEIRQTLTNMTTSHDLMDTINIDGNDFQFDYEPHMKTVYVWIGGLEL